MNRFTLGIATIAFMFSLSGAHAGPLLRIESTTIIAQAVKEDVDYNGRGESYWRQRADNLRKQLADQQLQLDTTNKQEQHCRNQQITYYRGLPRDCAAMYRNQKISIENRMTQIQKGLEVELPEEARKAGAFPGWLR
jgi:hypothetical protein